MRQGYFAASLAHAGESLTVLCPLNDTSTLVRPLLFRSIILHMAGDLDESQAAGEEALIYSRLAGDHWGEAYADFLLGHVTRLRGDIQEGYERMRRSVSNWRPFGDPHSLALALNFFSTAAIRVGRYAEAEACLQESFRLCQEMGDRWGMGTALRFLGAAALAQGDAQQAQTLLRRSLETHRGIVTGWDIACSKIYLADATRVAGDGEEAQRLLHDALKEAQAAHTDAMALEALAALAELYRPDAAEQSASLVAFVLQHPSSLFETRQRAGCLWETLAAGLSPEQRAVARAWAAGRSLEAVLAVAMQYPFPDNG
jgi:tetratricopeptide (TPR) repeat protein